MPVKENRGFGAGNLQTSASRAGGGVPETTCLANPSTAGAPGAFRLYPSQSCSSSEYTYWKESILAVSKVAAGTGVRHRHLEAKRSATGQRWSYPILLTAHESNSDQPDRDALIATPPIRHAAPCRVTATPMRDSGMEQEYLAYARSYSPICQVRLTMIPSVFFGPIPIDVSWFVLGAPC